MFIIISSINKLEICLLIDEMLLLLFYIRPIELM